MSALSAIALGVGCAIAASALFLVGLRTLLTPKLEISEQMAHTINETSDEVFRIKLVNRRRWSDAVKLEFEFVVLTPLNSPRHTFKGRRKLLVGPRKRHQVDAHKFERRSIVLRPPKLISIPRFKITDPKTSYAFRVTTHDAAEVLAALNDNQRFLRFRAYAENPWSNRGKTFEQIYSTRNGTVCGDFPLGPDTYVIEDDALSRRFQRGDSPAPRAEGSTPEAPDP